MWTASTRCRPRNQRDDADTCLTCLHLIRLSRVATRCHASVCVRWPRLRSAAPTAQEVTSQYPESASVGRSAANCTWTWRGSKPRRARGPNSPRPPTRSGCPPCRHQRDAQHCLTLPASHLFVCCALQGRQRALGARHPALGLLWSIPPQTIRNSCWSTSLSNRVCTTEFCWFSLL